VLLHPRITWEIATLTSSGVRYVNWHLWQRMNWHSTVRQCHTDSGSVPSAKDITSVCTQSSSIWRHILSLLYRMLYSDPSTRSV